MTALMAEGIPCGSGSCSEIYLEKAFDVHPSRPAARLPVARELGETSLMFQVHPGLLVEDMRDMVLDYLTGTYRRLPRPTLLDILPLEGYYYGKTTAAL